MGGPDFSELFKGAASLISLLLLMAIGACLFMAYQQESRIDKIYWMLIGQWAMFGYIFVKGRA